MKVTLAPRRSFDDLAGRFERPDARNRWDAPLFTLHPASEWCGVARLHRCTEHSTLPAAPEGNAPQRATPQVVLVLLRFVMRVRWAFAVCRTLPPLPQLPLPFCRTAGGTGTTSIGEDAEPEADVLAGVVRAMLDEQPNVQARVRGWRRAAVKVEAG